VTDIGFEPDIIIECTGVGQVIVDALRAVAAGGVVCLTGVGAAAPTVGSPPPTRRPQWCSATTSSWAASTPTGDTGTRRRNVWHAHERSWLAGLLSRCEQPRDFDRALARKPDDIKVVVQFAEV
jgi:threonine dehydrogenase-like Zn-dependent dehydrogenase